MNTEVKTDGPVSFQAIMTWLTFIVMSVCFAMGFGNSCARSDLPDEPSLEEYLTKEQTPRRQKLSESDWARLLAAETKFADRILALEHQHFKDDPNMVYLEQLEAYMPKGEYNGMKALYTKEGMDLDTAMPEAVNRVSGEQFADNRTGELCFMLPLEKKRYEAWNKEVYEELKIELSPNSCGRGLNRQKMNKTLAIMNYLLGNEQDVNTIIVKLESFTDEEIWKAWKATGSSKYSRPVGGITTSRHSLWNGVDENMYTNKKVMKIGKKHGWACGLSKKTWGITYGKSDKNHCRLEE